MCTCMMAICRGCELKLNATNYFGAVVLDESPCVLRGALGFGLTDIGLLAAVPLWGFKSLEVSTVTAGPRILACVFCVANRPPWCGGHFGLMGWFWRWSWNGSWVLGTRRAWTFGALSLLCICAGVMTRDIFLGPPS